jgi:hypothetical protein
VPKSRLEELTGAARSPLMEVRLVGDALRVSCRYEPRPAACKPCLRPAKSKDTFADISCLVRSGVSREVRDTHPSYAVTQQVVRALSKRVWEDVRM